MTSNYPYIQELKRFVDDRGYLDQIYNLDLEFEVKRLYLVGASKGIKRGMHGHKKEWKAFCVLTGSGKFVYATLEPPKHPAKVGAFILNSKKSNLLIVPPGYFNGFVALEHNTLILGLSSSTLKESLEDDYRQPYDAFGKKIWEIDNR